ncbi:prepilin-type N-terminal cleavage/methylation domain-containing protein, partial [Staphylococcus succinus]
MVKLLRTSKAFTYIEMVFVLAIVSILLILQFKYVPTIQTVTYTNHKFSNNL